MSKKHKVDFLYDVSAGSSGKGAAVARLAALKGYGAVSCNHGPNAGHWVRKSWKAEESVLFKALPSGAALPFLDDLEGLDPHVDVRRPRLYVGPNSAFELEQILKEAQTTGYTFGKDLFVHGRAALTEQHHKDAEGPNGSLSTLHVSSTMSGAGATYALKAMRQLDTRLAEEVNLLQALPAKVFWQQFQQELVGGTVLHEVAQGFDLSLDYGMHTRHGTYRNCTAQQAAADMGVRPDQVGDVYGNLRTFPIRVGNNFDADGQRVGYSGDWHPDQIELDWQTIGAAAGMPQAEIDRLYDRELTTVTKKLRRVASFSFDGLKYGAAFNGCTKLILNFAQYLDWSALDTKSTDNSAMAGWNEQLHSFIHRLEDESGLPVVMIGTGANHDSIVLPYGVKGL